MAIVLSELPTVTPAERTERLNQLIRVLREVGIRAAAQVAAGKESPFQMEVWCQEATGPLAPACGTQGCAAGWAGMDPWFVARGLTMKKAKPGDSHLGSEQILIHGQTYSNEFSALAKWFGIEEDEAQYLFGPDSYRYEFEDDNSDDEITPDHVIDHVENVLEDYKDAMQNA